MKTSHRQLDVLRIWFVIHFIADTAIAIPLFFFPTQTLVFIGWNTIDSVMTRIVAAALFGIGIESYLGRNSTKEQFIPMLNLKIIWSFFASLGLLLSILQGVMKNLTIGLVILTTFLMFHFIWIYYRHQLTRSK